MPIIVGSLNIYNVIKETDAKSNIKRMNDKTTAQLKTQNRRQISKAVIVMVDTRHKSEINPIPNSRRHNEVLSRSGCSDIIN